MSGLLRGARTSGGGLDIDDPRPWRVDALLDVVLAGMKPTQTSIGMDAAMIKRALRSIACAADEAYRQAREDPALRGAQKFERRQHAAALKKAISALSTLTEAGPLLICLPNQWKAKPRDDYENLLDDHETACQFVESLRDKLAELQQIEIASRSRGQRRPVVYDGGMWSACVGMRGALSLLRLEGLRDRRIELHIMTAAWMDAGLPEQHNAKNGETHRAWLAKYLKRLDIGWK